MTAPLLEVSGLAVQARVGGRVRPLVESVDLTVEAGEALALVGESGSGKSLTARAILGLLPRGLTATGSIRLDGQELTGLPEHRRARFRGREMTVILQDPFTMLHPMRRVGSQLAETLRDPDGGKLGRREREREVAVRLAEVGIDDASVARRYPFELSGGMRQRVAIAAALSLDPRLLIADEPSTALDVTTQAEILRLMRELQERRGMGLIFITHDLRVAFSVCRRVAVMYAGSLLETASTADVRADPLHPYTAGLLLAEPPVEARLLDLPTIPGFVPRPEDVEAGCAFAARCRWSMPKCVAARPPLVSVRAGRASACGRIDEIAEELAAYASSPERAPAIGPAREGGPPLVAVDGLVKTFIGRGGARVEALTGASLEIAAGECVGLVGESGSGKTTLGRCLVGLVDPTEGRIVIDGIDASRYDAVSVEDRRRLRRTIQVVFQDPYSSLNPARTIGATVREAIRQTRPDAPDAAVGALLEQVGLPAAYAHRKPVALSGGERQRVAIARAMAPEPKVIICDEAVSALDLSVQAQILNLLRSLREQRGLTYLFITHDLAVVRQMADRIYVMHRGQVVEHGAADQVLDLPQHDYTRRLIASIPGEARPWQPPPHASRRSPTATRSTPARSS